MLVTFYLTMPVLKASNAAALWESLIELTTFPFMAWRLFHFYRQEPPTAWGEIFTATVCLLMAIASILTQTDIFPALAHLHTVEGEAFVQFGALSIVAFIAMGLARQSVGIYRLAAMNNETLAQRISQKEQELQAHHDTMRSQEAERTLVAERGRIMADVHDGIGSQLLGLMLQARSGKVSREEMADGLQAALDDLYLVIDSLDTVEGSLENVLGAYRARIAPKCEAAGIALDWQIEGTQTGRLSAPTTMLQLCRILQEAISNAIRHGKATRIRMLLSESAGQTTVTLTDNGSGFDPSTVEGLGRGLTSMRKRAASIGARLAFTDANPGCRISITLPFAANPGHP